MHPVMIEQYTGSSTQWKNNGKQERVWQQLKIEPFNSKYSRLDWCETKEYVKQKIFLNIFGSGRSVIL